MQEKEHKAESKSPPFVPIVILVMFFVSAYFTYVRAYETRAIYYFFDEEEVDSFDPMHSLYGTR